MVFGDLSWSVDESHGSASLVEAFDNTAEACVMNEGLAQMVCLTSYGNLFMTKPSKFVLRSIQERCDRHVHNIEFLDEEGVIADTPAAWVQNLYSRQAKRSVLVKFGGKAGLPEPYGLAFGNRVNLGILIEMADAPELWRPKWLENADEGCTVLYLCSRLPPTQLPALPTLPDAESGLADALNQSFEFAVTNRLGWEKHFSKLKRMLDASDLVISDDLLPARGYTYEAHRLIKVAEGAWVFGGMGSWTDCADEKTGSVLYDAVITAILAAVNSFDKDTAASALSPRQ